jgi:ketosteroid isomerase-like protein
MSEQALRDANAAFYEAFQKLDLDGMGHLWARKVQVTCVHPGWDLVVGLRAVIESWRAIFEGTGELRFHTEDAHVTVRDGVGWVVSREVLRTELQGAPVENALTAVNTFVLEDDTWRIAHHHAGPVLSGRPRSVRPRDVVLH